MRWPDDLDGWPHREVSRQILCRPHRWHVQEGGTGPTLLLIHGAGGATQSWRGLFPLLAETHHVVAVDLPGQGFTELGARARCGLAPMAEDLASLAKQEGWQPIALIGHSAGAAIALQMSLTRSVPVICLNPALQNFDGVAGWLFPMLAKLLSINPLSAALFSASATPAKVRRLVEGTGSKLPPEGLTLYHRLATDREHVDSTLSMMAQWSLEGLLTRLADITAPVRVLLGADDKAVPPATTLRVCDRLPDCTIDTWAGLGHLVHEEAPERTARWIETTLNDLRLSPPPEAP